VQPSHRYDAYIAASEKIRISNHGQCSEQNFGQGGREGLGSPGKYQLECS
jgi:hypothetical protein